MKKLKGLLDEYKDSKMAIYGLGTETEKVISFLGEEIEVFGLLDGFKETGEIYGKPIVSLEEAIKAQVKLIVVVARPGSCKAIRRRIGDVCRGNGVALIDVRGNDLLSFQKTSYDFSKLNAMTEEKLWEKIQKAEVISFDLFDTLITRQVYSYLDLFELLAERLKERDIWIEEFEKKRLSAEKELSKDGAPTLLQIYDYVLQREIREKEMLSADVLAQMEWELEKQVILPRYRMVELFCKAVAFGKPVYIITDTYYRRNQIEEVLDICGIRGYTDVFVSCEYGVSKTHGLYELYLKGKNAASCLHIGDDAVADIEMPPKQGMGTFRIYSGFDLMETLGGLGLEETMETLSDRLKVGMFNARMWNNPFCFETEGNRLEVQSAYDIGYLLCGPMISDFVFWMDRLTTQQNIKNIWLCARDGYLLQEMYKGLFTNKKVTYFLTSRTAAIRAGMETEEDILYVDGMKFFGTPKESLRVRFGLEPEREKKEVVDGGLLQYRELILEKSKCQKQYYKEYICGLHPEEGEIAVFDFVAKGTTQMYLQRLVDCHLKGLYFLQLEPEFMKDKGLDIVPFYTEEEKNESSIFEYYYILETILTAPHPSISEFSEGGTPVYAKETRNEKDIQCFGEAQRGIKEYFENYLLLLPKGLHRENKRLDEKILSLIGKVKITDADFCALKVEDPFFNRMTDIKDVIE